MVVLNSVVAQGSVYFRHKCFFGSPLRSKVLPMSSHIRVVFVVSATLLLGLLGGSSARAEQAFAVLNALPDGGESGARSEVVLLVRDLRTYADWLAKQRALMKRSPPGRAYFDGGGDRNVFGFDWLEEAERIARVASPSGAPVPLGISLFAYSGPGGIGMQGLIKAEPGTLGRIRAEAADHEPWHYLEEEGQSYLVFGKERVAVLEGEDGWLRMAPRREMLMQGEGAPELLEGRLSHWVGDGEFALVLRGGGLLGSTLARLANNPVAEQILSEMNAIAIVWKPMGAKTIINRIVLDHPLALQFGEHVRPKELANSLLPLWGKDAVTMASLSLPPRLLEMIPGVLAQTAEAGKMGMPPELVSGLSKIDGRLGFASFGSPGDWALAMGFRDPASASGMVPQIQSWLKNLDPESPNLVMESMGAPPTRVFHARSGAGLQGVRTTNSGRTMLVVNQRSRIEALLARQATETKARRGTAEPLTAPMRELLQQPAMAVFYSILSTDGSLAEMIGLLLSGLKRAWKVPSNPLAKIAMLEKALEHLPTLLAASGFVGAMTYDMAGWLDIDGSVVVLQIVTSEI